jgi:hypothetical protein
MTSGQLGLAGSASTFTGSIAYATANIASTIVERDASNNINATTFTGALSGNLTAAATGGAAPGSTFTGAAAVTFDYHSFGAQVALTNPVTGPGSGATVGHLATMNAITGDVIADGGVVPTSFPGFGTTGSTAAVGNDSRITGAVPNTTTVNGHALSSNVVVSASDLTTGTLPAGQLPSQYKTWSCQPGLGDGLNAITAGTYLQSTCQNTTGVSVTLTGLSCYIDGGSSSTMNAAGNTLGALLTGAVTCSTSFAAGTQSANVTLTNGDYIKFTFVADGTAKQATWVVKGTY